MQIYDEHFLDQLVSIIPNYPMTRLLQLEESDDLRVAGYLGAYAKERDFDFDLILLDEEIVEKAKEHLQGRLPKRSSISSFRLKQQRYNRESKEYDFVFVTLDLSQVENLELFFKKLYHVIRNAGNLLLFIDRERDDYEHLKAILEKDLYVAVNKLDLSERYDVISAKRMHGWGD